MTAKSYDPLVSIEGMFNGSVTRIAQAIRDPENFGSSTKAVLTECSKRFQDALDDCEIQVLDAKWYLEHQLALNSQRREAKAREESVNTAKRKHGEMRDDGDEEGRSVEAKKPKTAQEQPAELQADRLSEPVREKESEPIPSKTTPPNIDSKAAEEPSEPSPDIQEQSQPSEQPKSVEQPKAPDKPPDKSLQEPSNPVDEFPKTTPQVTPAPTNDDFNFESMFGEPSADHGVPDNEINFDLNLADDFAANLEASNDANQNPSDLNSLLPDLESYANQPDHNANASNNQAMNFDLPDLGPNDFDAFFNDEGLSGGVSDDVMNADNMNMDNLDFDSLFKDD